jgi:di/tricarboxylate transporter
MTPEIVITLTILALATILFITEWLRVDLVALLVLGSLALTRMVTPAEALSGFSNPAVVTVWAVFILSGGLSRTGVANVVGRQISRLAGDGEARLLVVIMLTAGVLSAFMNNVGVAAMLLPVVMDIARRTGRSRSKLLMPLAFGSLLGGLTTLIGTPPNILASDALRDAGFEPFQLFDFAPVGVVVMLVGIAYMVLVGRFLLPSRVRGSGQRGTGEGELGEFYDMEDRLFVIHVPSDSVLAGKTLSESRLGSAVGLNVIGIVQDGRTRLSPGPDTVLHPDSRLLVAGRLDLLDELRGHQNLLIEESDLPVDTLTSMEIGLAEAKLSPDSPLVNQTLQQVDFRRKYGVIVLAILRDGEPLRTDLDNLPLRAGDILLVQGVRDQIETLKELPDLTVADAGQARIYRMQERLLSVRIPSGSILAGKTLAESRLAETFGLTVLGIIREDRTQLMPETGETIQEGDTLLVKGKAENVVTVRGIQDLEVERKAQADLSKLESEQVGLVEVVLSPHTTLTGKTLRQLHFREKYGLNVVAIYREGRAYRSNLRNITLRFGDALLLIGPREKLKVLAGEPDFLVLEEEIREAPRLDRALLSTVIMAGVVLTVLIGVLPISIAAVVGATLMVLTGCLGMEEAYRFIDWRAVFLIAGMLPLGIAMQNSGAAQFIAEGMISAIGGFDLLVLIGGLFMLTVLASQFMPNPVVTVLMAPIALNTASDMGLSPYSLMMVVALAASASFLSPVGHPANVLIMAPGGYRFTDYLRIGLPLSLLVLAVVLVVLPIIWPLM